MEDNWKLYMLRCGDGSFYTGIAVDVDKRLEAHRKGTGAKYTRGRGPLQLVYTEDCASHSEALRREYQIKQYPRAKKYKMVTDYERRRNEMQEFRFAQKEDTGLILSFIRALAEYENMEAQVVATEALLSEWLFEKNTAEVLFALENGKEVGFALFFHNFSTFLGRGGIYLEDLYVMPEYRGKGYGKGLLKQLGRIAAERGCGRLEWWCLDWNQPSIDFYRAMGAEAMTEWTVYRIAGETLRELGK